MGGPTTAASNTNMIALVAEFMVAILTARVSPHHVPSPIGEFLDRIERTKSSAAQKLLRSQNKWVGLKT
jgi:hypothetical protein